MIFANRKGSTELINHRKFMNAGQACTIVTGECLCCILCRTFEWLDDKKGGKKSTRVPAKQFIDSSLTQIQKQLQDERIFPTKFGLFTVKL